MEEIKKNKTKDIIELILPIEKEKKVYLGFYGNKNVIEEMKKYAHNYKMSLGEYIEEIHNTCKNIKNISKLTMKEDTEKITWGVLVEKNNFNDIRNDAKKYNMSLGEYIEYIHKLYIYNIR
ncbi:hypothetical protein [Brachyspira hampsonii]|uniref:Uncharacterized protein n=1 Tax=Brachyspira hampsonii TaxID=1287055 RepID=A0AAC9TUR2_9SPIR|nr:hypothetical protein [Brachyspira hampsonii]ASJ21592.1 hypothetical protein BHAMNSH16_08030 [Brachyspira hampsonii]ELV05960.1 hypothetical protein H263_07116 [Brachyspira hampsonii 30599]OEJ16451.1 hypothetical protein A9496_13470 [Brachyspira hampsonii]